MLFLNKPLMVAMACTILALAHAKADVLVNTGKGGTSDKDGIPLFGVASDGAFQYLAGKFTSGNGATINSVKAWMNSPFARLGNPSSGGDINLVLHADNNGIPGTALFTSKFALGIVTDPRWETFSGLDWTISSGTYWIALEPVDDNQEIGAMFEGAPNPLDAYAYNVNGNDGWLTFAYGNDEHGSLGFKVIGKADEAAGEIDLAVTELTQSDGRWGSDPYDNYPGKTIASKGCAMTTLAMAINYVGGDLDVPTIYPDTLNTIMDAFGDFDSEHSVKWAEATKDGSGNKLEYISPSPVINSNTNRSGAEQYLMNVLDNYSVPVIVGVKLLNNHPTHYVLVTGHKGNQFQIIDPYYQKTTLDDWDNSYMTRGYVRVVSDPRSTQIARRRTLVESSDNDNSGLYVTVSNNVLLQVIDPNGNITGTDFLSGDIKGDIPQSSDFTDALEDDVTGEPPEGSTHFVYIDQAVNGTYQINVQGVNPGSYVLSSSSVSSDGTLQSPMIINGTASAGRVDTYAATVTGSTITRSTVTLIPAGDGMAIEGVENGKVLVQRTGDLSAALTVYYKVKGTAVSGTDYEPLLGSVVIPAGSNKVKIKIKPIIGSPNHGGSTVKLVLKPATDGSYTVGGSKKAIIQLVEED